MMNKLLCLLLVIGLNSCNEEYDPKKNIIYRDASNNVQIGNANKVNFDGHVYIKFLDGTASSFVHDPDCPCKVNKK